MKKKIVCIAIIGLFISTATVTATAAEKKVLPLSGKDIQGIIDSIDESTLQEYLEGITGFVGRTTGTDVCEQAGEHVYQEFEKAGLVVNYEEWSDWGNRWNPRLYTGKNVIASIPGKKPETIIFSAHYDTHRNSPGALDNGAGVASLLAVAKALNVYSFENTIKFISFSGEEQGLLGAYDYAKDAKNVICVINADAIGNNEYKPDKQNKELLKAYSSYSSKWVVNELIDTSNDYGIGIDVQDRRYFGNSDDRAFNDYGYPAMQLYQTSGGMEDIFKSEHDTIDLVNITYVTKIAKVVAGALATLGDTEVEPRVEITHPGENKRYNDGEVVKDLEKGETIVYGDITVKTTVSTSTDTVEFKLFSGENKGVEYPREAIDSYTINDFENNIVEWELVNNNYKGMYTIRVTAYNSAGVDRSDEIEVEFVTTKSISRDFLKLTNIFSMLLEKIPFLKLFFNI